MREPIKKYRLIRGKKANFKTAHYLTREARDRAAVRFAYWDQESVRTEFWYSEDGWICVGVVDPPRKREGWS